MHSRRNSLAAMVKTPELETTSAPGVTGVGLASSSSLSSLSPASQLKTPRWSSIRGRFSTVQSRDNTLAPLHDNIDDGMWDKNDAAFLEEVARDSPSLLSPLDRFEASDRDIPLGRASMSMARITGSGRDDDADDYIAPRRPSLQLSSSPFATRTSRSFTVGATDPVHIPANQQMLAPAAPLGLSKYRARPMRKMASAAMLPDLPETKPVDDDVAFSSPVTSSSSAVSLTPPLLPPKDSPPTSTASIFASPSSSPALQADSALNEAGTITRRQTKNRNSLIFGLRKLMGKKQAEPNAAAPPAQSDAAQPTSSPPTIHSETWPAPQDASIEASPRGGLNLLGLAPDALGPAATNEASPDRTDKRATNKRASLRASPSIARKSPSLDLLRSFGPLGRTSTHKAAARNSVIQHISHEEARKLTGSVGPIFLETKEALAEHQSKYATLPTNNGLLDRAAYDMHYAASPASQHSTLYGSAAEQTTAQHANNANSGTIRAPFPSRPRRPEQENIVDNGSFQALTSPSSGEPVSSSSTRNNSIGMSSSASSRLSSISAATDPSAVLRASFSFQSQSYRPYSSDSRESRASQLSPPSSASSYTSHGFDAPGATSKPTHRTVSSLGSQAAWGSPFGNASMPPPPPPAPGAQMVARSHNHRRSLNGSSGGSRPWSAFMALPMNGAEFPLPPHRGLSGASISRPVSVTSSAFTNGYDDARGESADADLTFRASDFARARAASTAGLNSDAGWRVRADSIFSEPGNSAHRTAVGAINSPSSQHAPSSAWTTPSDPHLIALASPTASTSQHSHQSYHSCSNSDSTSAAPGAASASSTTLGSANSNGRALNAPIHRLSASSSSLSHRKRPSFGLAIEPAAHSAFDSIPSPLLRTRRISLAHPEGSSPQRPLSTSSLASAIRTPSGSSYGTSLHASARASAATLSSRRTSEDNDESLEIETLLDGSPKKASFLRSTSLTASVPASESVMAAATVHHRHSASVPMDEDDSPRQHAEANWSRITGTPEPARPYTIFSVNEEASSGRLSQASKDIAFGSIAGMISKVFEHPFDLVKVRLQTQSADRPARYAGAFDCFKQTYLQEGIRGLYRGLSMPVFGATLENACLFFVYNQMQSAIRWANGEARSGSAAKADAEAPLSIPQLAIAAAGAGATTSLVLTPIELIKCKMQVQMITRAANPSPAAGASAAPIAGQLQQSRSMHTSAVRAAASAQTFKSLDGPLTLLRRTVATDGIRGLWLGQTGTLLRETGGGVAWFLAFESASRYLISRKKTLLNRTDVTKKDLSALELVGAGALAGVSYNVVLFPADSVKSTMQTEREMLSSQTGGKWKGTGFLGTFQKIYRTRGIKGLYAGCGVTCLRSAPSSAIIFLLYNKLEKLSDEYGL
ncbi:Mitochondrial substrate/solute carrier [Kalmanozyma brasiliensis GHG001]|uniref:Mitochondrial substrate/solute carrier n=1 Tax=Kalmanozyma brasiliensis (strain GHG001) TaxID=1365824 RepID=UPI0028681105|nr:Mitochondrial substrate/solute carrier [Kalmanozyma brasiliensis GHG001]EST09050.2 Mitochondrial substrate/solute carrier [Kalmanozyma brasiliensis GHG001]